MTQTRYRQDPFIHVGHLHSQDQVLYESISGTVHMGYEGRGVHWLWSYLDGQIPKLPYAY